MDALAEDFLVLSDRRATNRYVQVRPCPGSDGGSLEVEVTGGRFLVDGDFWGPTVLQALSDLGFVGIPGANFRATAGDAAEASVLITRAVERVLEAAPADLHVRCEPADLPVATLLRGIARVSRIAGDLESIKGGPLETEVPHPGMVAFSVRVDGDGGSLPVVVDCRAGDVVIVSVGILCDPRAPESPLIRPAEQG